MKKLVLICIILCSFIFMITPAVHATAETSEYFTVCASVEAFNGILPGDTFTETFTVKNTESQAIKVRLYDVENVDDSILYSVLAAGWVYDDSEVIFGAIDDLATGPHSEWHSLDPGETWTLKLDMHFPEECGNQYQDTTLVANFIFETRIPENTAPPYTGDSFQSYIWAMLAGVSGCAFIFLLRLRKRKYDNLT